MPRLVLPAGASPSDPSWIERLDDPTNLNGPKHFLTWAQVAAENKVEVADAQWLTDNRVVQDGSYGVHQEAAPLPVPVDPASDPVQVLAARFELAIAKLEGKGVLSKADSDEIGAALPVADVVVLP